MQHVSFVAPSGTSFVTNHFEVPGEGLWEKVELSPMGNIKMSMSDKSSLSFILDHPLKIPP